MRGANLDHIGFQAAITGVSSRAADLAPVILCEFQAGAADCGNRAIGATRWQLHVLHTHRDTGSVTVAVENQWLDGKTLSLRVGDGEHGTAPCAGPLDQGDSPQRTHQRTARECNRQQRLDTLLTQAVESDEGQ